MKRSGSRASKVSNDAQDSVENSFPGIPDAKWQEFLEKEDTDLFILGLREEIIQKCMEICFDNYLEKQAVAFTVHCAYLAWCKVLNVYYMVRDPGDTDDSKTKTSWEPDLEPETSIIDSWGSQCISSIKPKLPTKVETEREKEICISQSVPEVCSWESVESCSFASGLFDLGEGEYNFSPRIFSMSDWSGIKSPLSSSFFLSMDTAAKPVDVDPCVHYASKTWGKKHRTGKN